MKGKLTIKVNDVTVFEGENKIVKPEYFDATLRRQCNMNYPARPVHVLARIRDTVIGWFQWFKYRKHRKAALLELNQITDLFEWYRSVEFKWSADKIDFSNIPWVSVHFRWGDCDDMMRIAEIVIGGGQRCYISNKEGEWHAIYVYKDTKWYAASNQQRLGPFGAKNDAAKAFYGTNTDQILWEGEA